MNISTAFYEVNFFLFLSQQASQSGYDALVYVAKRETLVMPNDPIPEPTPVDHTSLRTHYLSQVIMHQQNMSTHGVPKSTTGDGNCFFHAISLALYGTEQYSTEMRLRTCVQMCLHPQVYKDRADANDIFILSPPFEDSAMDCSRPTAYSSIWTMLAATDALGISITSIYPPLNGHQDLPFKVLNTVFNSSTVWQPSTNINIMWTHTEITSDSCGTWTPNHFVPVFKDNSVNISFVPQSHSSPLSKTSNQDMSDQPVTSPNSSFKQHPAAEMTEQPFQQSDSLDLREQDKERSNNHSSFDITRQCFTIQAETAEV